ncbi:MAG: ABC transporter ATP-binding protein [Deltaproteobacteria bacterium]|nr:ABC transporter ATP-binding protein [Deltaproteobacteria bacterium]
MGKQVHIRVADVHKSYGENHVLRGVDLLVYEGLINVVIGGSGAGKTVLMRQVIGLEKPDSGQIFIDGKDIVPLGEMKMGPVRRKFGMVFQHAALFDSMTVFDNVAFPLREHTRLGRGEIEARVLDKLAILGLEGAEDRYPSDISGGMRKRVGVARALILEPMILLYDEPTTGLDPIAARNVDELVRETADKFDVTSFVISHDMTTTFTVGHYISLLHEGRIRITGVPEEIISSTDPEVIRFLRSSGVDPRTVLEGAGAPREA